MNKKFFIAWLVIFIAWMAGDFLVHGVLLKADYMQLAKLYRSEAESRQYFPWMLLAHVLMAGAFTWIYARGREAQAVAGDRASVTEWRSRYWLQIPGYLIYYAVQPLTRAIWSPSRSSSVVS